MEENVENKDLVWEKSISDQLDRLKNYRMI